MEENFAQIHQFLSLLGLSEEEIKIYLALTQRGMLTTLELSRATDIGRTQVYRFLEKMKKRGVVEEVIDEHRLMAKAVEISQLERLVKENERRLKNIRELFPQVQESLMAKVGQNQPKTKVLFYRGKSGLQQMVWNTLRAERECVGYTYRRIEEMVGEPFMVDWRRAFVEKGLVFRDVFSDHYLESLKQAPRQGPCPINVFTGRYICPKIFDVNMHMDIYNDVVAYSDWYEDEVFGVEIYNKRVAQFQKQMFETIWKKAKKILL